MMSNFTVAICARCTIEFNLFYLLISSCIIIFRIFSDFLGNLLAPNKDLMLLLVILFLLNALHSLLCSK